MLFRSLFVSFFTLLPLLGGTWILGLLFLIDNDSVALAWIFTIVNSLQVVNMYFDYEDVYQGIYVIYTGSCDILFPCCEEQGGKIFALLVSKFLI